MRAKVADSGERIEKVMTLSPAEFANSVAVLVPAGAGANHVTVPLGTGSVSILYQALPGVRLGGLLELPQARVVLTFDNVSAAEREQFVRRFEVIFQRGGG
jgi:hypothetical protein